MSITIPRYLVSFDAKHVPHYFADILILGGGLAGLRAAMAVGDNQSVVVITKEKIEQSNSNYAQGGIAGVMNSGGSVRGSHCRHASSRRSTVR